MPTDPTFAVIVAALEAPKHALLPRQWSGRAREDFLQIRCSLSIDGVVEQGLALHLQCPAKRQDESVSISLLVETAIKPKSFARIDWRGTAHLNTDPLCGPLWQVDVGTTHFHDPRLWVDPTKVGRLLRDNLPVAVALDPSPGDYGRLLEAASVLLNVHNLTDTPTPPWQLSSPLFPPKPGP